MVTCIADSFGSAVRRMRPPGKEGIARMAEDTVGLTDNRLPDYPILLTDAPVHPARRADRLR